MHYIIFYLVGFIISFIWIYLDNKTVFYKVSIVHAIILSCFSWMYVLINLIRNIMNSDLYDKLDKKFMDK